ncbi:YjbQ family protein [bacterium]|nr:YjbQ family protein [bacterium]
MELTIQTKGHTDIIDITEKVSDFVKKSGIKDGILTIFVVGSTAAITTIEYEKGLLKDIKNTLEKLVPEETDYEHNKAWGDNNGYAHIRASLMKPNLSIPIENGNLILGTWQQIVLIDFDNRPRKRKIILKIIRS